MLDQTGQIRTGMFWYVGPFVFQFHVPIIGMYVACTLCCKYIASRYIFKLYILFACRTKSSTLTFKLVDIPAFSGVSGLGFSLEDIKHGVNVSTLASYKSVL
jgi:hypothetical protein